MKRYKRAITICRSLKQGAGVYVACKAANTSMTAFYNWRHEKPKFDKFVQTIFDCRTANVVDALYKGALEGNPTCMIFWLKNKAGWHDTPLVDQSQHTTLQIIINKTYKGVEDSSDDKIRSDREANLSV